MPHPLPHGRRSLGRRLLFATALLALASAGAVTGIGWYVSSEIERVGLRPQRRDPAAPLSADASVVSLETGLVTLRDGATASDAALRDSVWGLHWSRGWGMVGPIVGSTPVEATRPFRLFQGTIAPGEMVEVDKKALPGDPRRALGLPFEEVLVPTDLGDCPAWRLTGSGGTWAIFVHGKGGGRREALRALGEIADFGLPILVLTYRNDPEAPRSPDGLYHYGLREWKDVEAGVRYATSRGAERVLLVGYSMGGGIAIQFLARSPLASHVVGVVLDAPMLDFGETVDLGIRLKRLPPFGLPVPAAAGRLGKWIAAARFGVAWDSLAMMAAAERIDRPMLIFHGDADDIVPIETSRRLAASDPEEIRLIEVPGARHVESWNVSPGRYRLELRRFVSRFLAGP